MAQAKRFKEALNEFIHGIWAKQIDKESMIAKKELTIIQTTIVEGFWAKDNAN